MTYGLFETPLFYLGEHYVSIFGLLGGIGLFAIGLILARFLQSSVIRRLFSRFKLDTNFIAIVTMFELIANTIERRGAILMNMKCVTEHMRKA